MRRAIISLAAMAAVVAMPAAPALAMPEAAALALPGVVCETAGGSLGGVLGVLDPLVQLLASLGVGGLCE